MKILVTDGAGFIGSAVIRQIIQNTSDSVVNVEITYAGNLATLAEAAQSSRYCFEQAEICDQSVLENDFHEHQPDAVMHLAAVSYVDQSIDGPAGFMKTNNIISISSSAYPSPASRPLNSRLDTQKLRHAFGLHLPDWQQGVSRALREITAKLS